MEEKKLKWIVDNIVPMMPPSRRDKYATSRIMCNLPYFKSLIESIKLAPKEQIGKYELPLHDGGALVHYPFGSYTIQIDKKYGEIIAEVALFLNKIVKIDEIFSKWIKTLSADGDLFIELITDIDAPRDGVLMVQEAISEYTYRIQNIKQELLEYQMSREGPDYKALAGYEGEGHAIRFKSNQMVHFASAPDWYGYGTPLPWLTNTADISHAFSKGITEIVSQHLRLRKIPYDDKFMVYVRVRIDKS